MFLNFLNENSVYQSKVLISISVLEFFTARNFDMKSWRFVEKISQENSIVSDRRYIICE